MQTDARKQEILDVAQDMIQKRGFNGFSYADIAQVISIRKASIHHHFSSKAALGAAVIKRYREVFNDLLAHINAEDINWLDKIRKYSGLYADVLAQNKLCLCGMLAADIETLPRVMQSELHLFFQENVIWLSSVLAECGKAYRRKKRDDMSWQIISSLQGAVMLARMQSNEQIFHSACAELYAQLDRRI